MTDRASYYFDSYHERRTLRHVFHKRRIDALAALVPTPGRVLDAGCGSGVLCRLLADRGCRVTGVDIDPARVAWCRRLVPEGEFRAGDVRTVQLSVRYDAVVCSEVLEHLDAVARPAALRNLAAHLRPGGTLIVTVPSGSYVRLEPAWEIFRAWRYGGEGHDDEECHQRVDPVAFARELRAAGCEVTAAGSTCWGLVRWWRAEKR